MKTLNLDESKELLCTYHLNGYRGTTVIYYFYKDGSFNNSGSHPLVKSLWKVEDNNVLIKHSSESCWTMITPNEGSVDDIKITKHLLHHYYLDKLLSTDSENN